MSSLTITLDDELLQEVRRQAEERGTGAEEVAAEVLRDAFVVDRALPPDVLAEAVRRAAAPLGGERDARVALREVALKYGLDLDLADVTAPRP